jgi:hypothetical protein
VSSGGCSGIFRGYFGDIFEIFLRYFGDIIDLRFQQVDLRASPNPGKSNPTAQD